jgi:hypothetical protein
MTRLWPEGAPIQVTVDQDGQPRHIVWQDRPHLVAHITRRWRVRSDWWREMVWRDYFKLITNTGLLLIIYHDLRQETWHVQQLFD